jgi:hypothetical protein
MTMILVLIKMTRMSWNIANQGRSLSDSGQKINKVIRLLKWYSAAITQAFFLFPWSSFLSLGTYFSDDNYQLGGR